LRKIIATLIVAACALMSTAVPILAEPSHVTASAHIIGQCGMSLSTTPSSETLSISFGSVNENDAKVPADKTVTVTLGGSTNTPTTVNIGGNAWSGPNPMAVGQTKYSLTGGSSWTELTSSAFLFSSNAPNHSETTTFALDVLSVQPAGDYSQTITYDFRCNQT